MEVTRLENGNIQLSATLDELSWLGQCLNECCNGFGVSDFQGRIGVSQEEVSSLLAKIVSMYPATLSGGS